MALKNKLNITDQIELAKMEEAIMDKINDREIFMKGIDVSYYYEGYSEFKTNDL